MANTWVILVKQTKDEPAKVMRSPALGSGGPSLFSRQWEVISGLKVLSLIFFLELYLPDSLPFWFMENQHLKLHVKRLSVHISTNLFSATY